MRAISAGLAMLLACGVTAPASAAEPPDELAAGFLDPPAEARPLVFWQWINGNVSQEGIRLDLEWMQRIGIGGALMFDIGFSRPPVPQYVEKRVGFGTAEWRQAVRFAAAEARRLGLLLGAQSSGGWSVSGGPAVKPGQAMKKLVWSETLLTPATRLPLRLLPPPSNNGPYQDLPIDNVQYLEPTRSGDIAVLAIRLPEAEQAGVGRARYSGPPELALLDDGSYLRATELAPDAQGNATLDARLDFVPRSVTIGVDGRRGLPAGRIEASADGVEYRFVVELPGNAAQHSQVVTFALGERSERIWRILFTGQAQPVPINEARFEPGARVDRAQEKAGFGVLAGQQEPEAVAPQFVIDPKHVVDLTSQMAADGTLRWRPREGRWLALRFGWSLTGRRTVPATAESIGLEVDKLDAAAVRAFAESFFDQYADAMGEAGALDIAFTDSWEAGQQSWTLAMLEEFATRRGYDLRPWLPVLTGRIVGDAIRSEKFLADYRRTISDLLTENHYGVLADSAHRRGMQFYSEAAGTDLPTVIDGLQAKGRVDVPTGEYWYWPEDGVPKTNHVADVREAASAAHIYGHRMVAAESLTSRGEQPWALGPAQLRRMVDRFFAEGVNRVILHTSAHQPFTDRRPGMTLRQYGQHFTRNETWAEDAGDWIRYLARTSYLLQQGQPVADVAVFLGDEAPLSPPFSSHDELRRIPGLAHDYINAEVLMTRLSVRDGRLVLPDGVGYRILAIPPQVRRMSGPVLDKLRALKSQGATVIGLDGDASGWEDLRGGNYLLDVDFLEGPELPWAHRATADADIYFISNQTTEAFDQVVTFRVSGRHVELWDAVDGSRSPASYITADRTTFVSLQLAPLTSKFVVFRGAAAAGGQVEVREPRRYPLREFDGDWQVTLLDLPGAPRRVELPAGESWTTQTDPEVRYYSGRASYARKLRVPVSWLAAGRRIELDLGAVGELARVKINGKDLGVWWNPPLRRDVTGALRAGENRLEIIVTNYWVNRMIGDEQPGARHDTFAPIRPYQADSELRPSGLLGPVRLLGGKSRDTR